MKHLELDSKLMQAMFFGGLHSLENNKERLNKLNVFPVADGDTGTNMERGLLGGTEAKLREDSMPLGDYMNAFSKGVFLSARGNSGAIFSQFIHGFADGFKGMQTTDISGFVASFAKGVTYAYNAVITPTEGTMLTVFRETSELLTKKEELYDSFEECFADITKQMNISLENTPNLLPVLKEFGVIDSGGAGVLCIFEGMEQILLGNTVELKKQTTSLERTQSAAYFDADSELEFGYCTEFVLQLMNKKIAEHPFDLNDMIAFLESVGNSIVAVQNEDVVKVHVHTFDPDKVIAYARIYGEFVTFKMENMSVQHNEVIHEEENQALDIPEGHFKFAVVAVSSASGISKYFKEIGATVILNGGQTCNPAIGEFIEIFHKLDADHIVVLPNNSNIVLTANQAAESYTDKDIRVLPTKTIAEGYCALSMMNTGCATIEEFLRDMTDALPYVTSASITKATRNVSIDHMNIHEGNYLGLSKDDILATNVDFMSTLRELLQAIPDMEDKQVITLFYGKDVSEEELHLMEEFFETTYPDIEVGYINGKQDIYQVIMAIE